MKLQTAFIIISCLIFGLSCKKKEETSLIPSIEFIDISPKNAIELQDEIIISIKYKDENGDLGENDNEVKNLFVLDNRNGVEYSFRIQQLAPSGSEISIEGNLTINIKTMVITDDSNEQEATFSVYLYDRAKNKSNTISTTPITILKNETN
jgi:hypothetical protein